MRRSLVGAVLAATLMATAAPAQDDGAGEIIVTAMRRIDRSTDDPLRVREIVVSTPAAIQTLRRTADFAVQQVVIASDTTDEDEAKAEVLAMTRKAIDLARASGVEVATGEMVVEPLTVANYKELEVTDDDNEIDGQLVKFLVKVPLAAGIDAKAALARIDKFIKTVPAVGRA